MPDRSPAPAPRGLTRRRALAGGVASLAGVAFAGFELVSHGVLPGQHALDALEGACSLTPVAETRTAAGPSRSGSFYSLARRRQVGYTIALPPGHRFGDRLPLAIVLHAFRADHAHALAGMSLAGALAAHVRGVARAPIALAAADGGLGYWNRHPGDDPMAMVVDELLPRCRALGVGRTAAETGVLGISMGGYGALLLAERHPGLVSAVAAISPAIWTSYAQARGANPGAYASAADFAQDDVVAHTDRLGRVPIRVASGRGDPFAPGVRALARRLPASAAVRITGGCHDVAFFARQQPFALDFVAGHLASA